MSLPQEVASSYQTLVESGNIRYVSLPAAAVGIAAISDAGGTGPWDWSAYVQIAAAAAIADPSWLCGILFHTGVVETHYGELGIAIGAGGVEVDLAEIPFVMGIPSAVGVAVALPTWLAHPIKINGTPRLAVRIRKDTGASLAGGTLKLILAEAIGA